MWLLFAALSLAQGQRYDAIVYGSTPGGIQSAVAAGAEGLSVLLVSPTARLGGLMAGGLGATDVGNAAAIGGASRAFFTAVGDFKFPPHVALAEFQRLLAAADNVTVLYNATLTAVARTGTRLTSITVGPTALVEGEASAAQLGPASSTLSASYFLDATYEGDLIAMAGVSTAIGREGRSEFGEDHAGVLAEPSAFGSHQFKVDVDPTWPNGTLLPQISALPPGPVGSGDGKVQAYNFRLCMTQNISNFLPFPRPPGYSSEQWELARRYLRAANITTFYSLMNLTPVGQGKTDTNNNGAVSTDCIGCSWGYPAATPAQRRALWDAHYEYQAGFYWFLQHDPALPAELRREALSWGLAADEFTETGGWPPQLYVREGRRMRGAYVFTQMDRQYNLTKPDSIGLFSYNIDSHNVQRYAVGGGKLRVLNEGDFELYGGPLGQIPYRVITPVRAEATNLLAPVPLSATHMGYGTLRLEPQYMIIGQSAGVAVAQALRSGAQDVQDVDVAVLQARLRELGQIIDL
jgi:hypothetical protein